MKIKDIKKVHCIGVGGAGVSALAKYFLARGVKVSGSNIVDENLESLRDLGLDIFVGHRSENLKEGTDLVIYSSAVPDDNPEILKAKEGGFDILSYTEALGEIMKDTFGIAVSGTNGKTTTTAILGLMLVNGGIDPTVVLGGNVGDWNGNFKAGNSDVFVVEGCEYKKNILNLSPSMIVLTNIEADHLDCYSGGIEEIKDTFSKYIDLLPEGGTIVANTDDENITEVLSRSDVVKINYGIDDGRMLKDGLLAKNIIIKNGIQEFEVVWRGESLGKFTTILPGKFNIYNILAATATALYLDVSVESIRDTVAKFRSTERRFEVFRLPNDKILISDYAHHPTAVCGTIIATKEFYKNSRVLAVFQPHQKDRTIKLFDEFVGVFDSADEVILSEIYEVSGRNDAARDISSNDLVKKIQEQNKNLKISFAKDITETEDLIKSKMDNFNVVLIMGAGDINSVVKKLTN